MSLLGDLAAYVDSLKRTAGNSLRDLRDDPQGLLSMRAAQLAESLPALPQSVMPGVDSAGLGPMRPTAQDWSMGAAMNAPTMGLLGHTVYHGSPYKFDKFDASKIGTGEGAQAYGYGTYLAESPGVAKYYQVAEENAFPIIRKGNGRLDLALRESTDEADNKIYSTIAAITPRGTQFGDGMLDAIKRRLQDDADYFAGSPAGRAADAALAKFDTLRPSLKGAKLEYDRGSLYTVDLPDEWLPKMLDWDKPLSQQHPDLRMIGRDAGIPETATGAQLYQGLVNSSRDGAIARGQNAATTLGASQAAASNDLRAFGIPGIRYKDQGSRGKEGGTYNYVVFPGMEHLLKILERE